MTVLLVAMIAGMFGLTKWIQTMNDYDKPDWKTVVQGELTNVQEQLGNPMLSDSDKERLEGKEKILDYRLANSVAPLDDHSREKMIMDSSGIGSIVVLLTVIVAAGIVAAEFSQGTIKMLLSRPVKRWKILTSKYVTVMLFGALLMLVGFMVSIVCAYLFFQSGNGQELVWNGKEVVDVAVVIWECLHDGDIRVYDRQCLPFQLTGNRSVIVHLLHGQYGRHDSVAI